MTPSKRVHRLQTRQKAHESAKAEVAKIAVGYLRVSTEEQATNGSSLTTQAEAIRAFAKSQGYDLLDVITDPGVSGASPPGMRPGFKRVIELAEQGAFSVLLVWKFDRLARQIVYAVTAANDLHERHRVELRSVTEPIDTATPMGRTVFAILAGMAEQERNAITERTLAGRKAKAAQGGYACGEPPFGYERDKEGGLVINEAEAETVRRIFRRRAEKATLEAIATELNADGIKSPRGRQWWKAQIRYVLDNPRYHGQAEYLFRHGGTELHVRREGSHPALV